MKQNHHIKYYILIFIIIFFSFGTYYYIFYDFRYERLLDLQTQNYNKIKNAFIKNQKLQLENQCFEKSKNNLDNTCIETFAKEFLDHINFYNGVQGLVRFYHSDSTVVFEQLKDKTLMRYIQDNQYINTNDHLKHNDSYFQIYSFDIYSNTYEKIGDFVFFSDLTKHYNEFNKASKNLLINFIISVLLIYGILVYIFRSYTSYISNQYKKTKSILDNQENIIILTYGNKLLDANKKFFDFTQYENIELFLKDHNCICDLFVQEKNYLQPMMYDMSWSQYVLENPNHIHFAKMIKNGQEHIFKVYVSRLPISNFKESNMVATFVDITQELNMQKDLETKNFLLQQQSKLVAIGEMIGNIAHQWRQPLSVITTVMSGLNAKNEHGLLQKDDIKNANQDILRNANFLSDTIDNFKNFFKIDKKQTTFYIAQTIKNTMAIVAASYETHFIKLTTTLDENVYTYGNENMLSQIILNILSNAKDALIENNIEEKMVHIELSSNEKTIIIQIVDNAGGIDSEVLKQIFDQYFTTKENGTGIGLSMSQDIITKYFEGKLYVQNIQTPYGNGACFTIEFPKKSHE